MISDRTGASFNKDKPEESKDVQVHTLQSINNTVFLHLGAEPITRRCLSA